MLERGVVRMQAGGGKGSPRDPAQGRHFTRIGDGSGFNHADKDRADFVFDDALKGGTVAEVRQGELQGQPAQPKLFFKPALCGGEGRLPGSGVSTAGV